MVADTSQQIVVYRCAKLGLWGCLCARALLAGAGAAGGASQRCSGRMHAIAGRWQRCKRSLHRRPAHPTAGARAYVLLPPLRATAMHFSLALSRPALPSAHPAAAAAAVSAAAAAAAGLNAAHLAAPPAAMSERRLDLLLDRNSKLVAQCDVQRKQINQLEKR